MKHYEDERGTMMTDNTMIQVWFWTVTGLLTLLSVGVSWFVIRLMKLEETVVFLVELLKWEAERSREAKSSNDTTPERFRIPVTNFNSKD